jgi:hypothetical protein
MYIPIPTAVLVAMNAEAPPATSAVALSAVTLPVADTVVAAKEVTEVAAPKVAVVVTVPVDWSIETVWKPFSERTGPLKVVLAIINLRVVALVHTVSTMSARAVGTN